MIKGYLVCLAFQFEAQKLVMLEAGCGVGNCIFPLLEEDLNIFIYACDFSPRAVQFVKVSANIYASVPFLPSLAKCIMFRDHGLWLDSGIYTCTIVLLNSQTSFLRRC